jgi:hypothetical protein
LKESHRLGKLREQVLDAFDLLRGSTVIKVVTGNTNGANLLIYLELAASAASAPEQEMASSETSAPRAVASLLVYCAWRLDIGSEVSCVHRDTLGEPGWERRMERLTSHRITDLKFDWPDLRIDFDHRRTLKLFADQCWKEDQFNYRVIIADTCFEVGLLGLPDVGPSNSKSKAEGEAP